MDVDIGPSSAFAPGFPQAFSRANPRTVQFPATTTAAIPASSIYHNHLSSNPSSNSDALYSNHGILQNQRNLDAGGGMRKMRKRKAESQENERLSKRLSLLNLEKNGQKLYVPVESPKLRPTESAALTKIPENDVMQLDDSKHKVYIYDLDAELSSDESDADSNRLVFLSDIEKHLKQNRIPPSLLANKDGELAGMQMVLYSEPTSLTVPKEQDSVRKAIIEARQRVREKQKEEREQTASPPSEHATSSNSAFGAPNTLNGFTNHNMMGENPDNYDPDAMDVD
ncbi:hypothetical protein F4818DRAFT_133644 [Hypoxylon cercidicola]|nr:hypothetical protein F4818DRAFT_133644 [Hypoxylon cercidicola]